MKLTRIALCLVLLGVLTSCYDRPPEVEQALVQAERARTPKRVQGRQARSAPREAEKVAKKPPTPPSKAASAPQQDVEPPEAASPHRSDQETNGTATENRTEPPQEATPEAEGEQTQPGQEEGPTLVADADADSTEREDAPEASESEGPADEMSPEPSHKVDWASYITVDELRQEIEFMLNQMATKIATRRDFDRYYKELQGDASVLGVLGIILQEHPDAGKLRRVGAAVAEASIDLAIATEERSAASYAETKEVLDRVRAALTKGSASADVEPVEWEDVADLVALMTRMDVAYRRLRGVVNSPTFTKDAYEVAHEAKLLAILAKVSSYYRDNEPGYVRYAGMLEQAALQAAQASLGKNVDQARKSVSEIGRVCNECHRAFRLERATGNTLDF